MQEMVGQVSIFDQDILCGKTSSAASQAPEKTMSERTSDVCWKRWRGSSKKESLFLDLRRESGVHRESSSVKDIPSHGVSQMPNGGALHSVEEGLCSLLTSADTAHLAFYLSQANTTEMPNEIIQSRLSDILEDSPDPKYNLSAKACLGILTRASRRGKEMPPMLKEALEQMIALEQTSTTDSRVGINEDGKVQALTSRMGTGGGNVPMVMTYCKAKRAQSASDNETWVESDTANTLNAFDVGDVRTTEAVVYAVDQGGGKSSASVVEGKSPTLCTTHGGEPAVVYALDRASFNQGKNAQYDFEISDKGINSNLVANGPGAVAYIDTSVYKHPRYIVRRLTPLECERLQGYPDGWTDIGEWTDSNGKKRQTSDAARYKALGNSIALPQWRWLLKRICACYERDATMASLFDGIGGFGYLWEQLNGKGSCLWASEIEEFPIAVTKVRIGGDT